MFWIHSETLLYCVFRWHSLASQLSLSLLRLSSRPLITQTRRFSTTSTTSSEPMGAMTRSPASCSPVPFQSQNVPRWSSAPLRVHVDHVAYRPQETRDDKEEIVSTCATVECDFLKRKTFIGYKICANLCTFVKYQ